MSAETKRRLLARVTRHAAFDGWGAGTLDRAAAELGIDQGEARALFPAASAT